MKQSDIDWLKSIPGAEDDGTIQSVLLRDDLQSCRVEATLKFLVQALKMERDNVYKDYLLLKKACIDNGIDVNVALRLS